MYGEDGSSRGWEKQARCCQAIIDGQTSSIELAESAKTGARRVEANRLPPALYQLNPVKHD